jgi:hypothetical protein
MSSTELTTQEAQALALAEEIKAGIDDSRLVTPGLKLTQALTREVAEGDAEAGHFINGLTGEDFGDSIEFVVAATQLGWFLPEKFSPTDRSFSCYGTDVAPANWPEEYAGRPFSEIPDSEESFRLLVQANELEWGSGPKISRVHSFLGLVNDSPVPVRWSLMRTGARAAGKLETLIKFGRMPWDTIYEVTATRQQNAAKQTYYEPSIKQVGPTDAERQHRAVLVALAFRGGSIEDIGESLDDPVEPPPVAAEGALAV